MTDAAPTATTTRTLVPVGGTALAVEQRGAGPALLLVHGAGEDASMLAAQAEALATTGYHVVSYDRRGTGDSGREGWPGEGADQHADDAAALLRALDLGPAVTVGLSSGGVVALAMAARHPESASRVIAWEPPAVGLLPGGDAITAALMAPIDAHLAAHPGDFEGAQAMLLTQILGFPVDRDDPAFAAARANAEPMVRDDPTITLRRFAPDELTGRNVEIVVGSTPNDLVAGAAEALAGLLDTPATVVPDADHEVYLTDPEVLASVVGPPSAACR